MYRKSEIERYKTLVVICLGMWLLFAISGYRIFVWTSLIVSIGGIISPTIAAAMAWLWDLLAQVLGFIMPKVILILVFYFLLFPLSAISKLFRKSMFRVKNDKASFFTDVEKKFSRQEFDKLW